MAIMQEEQQFEVSVEQNLNNIGETTFKAIRRVLPVTQTKINWGNILAYKVGKTGQ